VIRPERTSPRHDGTVGCSSLVALLPEPASEDVACPRWVLADARTSRRRARPGERTSACETLLWARHPAWYAQRRALAAPKRRHVVHGLPGEAEPHRRERHGRRVRRPTEPAEFRELSAGAV